MTERLNTLEAKVRTCLYSPVWQKFPRVAAEKEVELAALGRSGACPSVHSEEHAGVVVLPQGTRAVLLCTWASLTSGILFGFTLLCSCISVSLLPCCHKRAAANK